MGARRRYLFKCWRNNNQHNKIILYFFILADYSISALPRIPAGIFLPTSIWFALPSPEKRRKLALSAKAMAIGESSEYIYVCRNFSALAAELQWLNTPK